MKEFYDVKSILDLVITKTDILDWFIISMCGNFSMLCSKISIIVTMLCGVRISPHCS
jgi:hypothetical protein